MQQRRGMFWKPLGQDFRALWICHCVEIWHRKHSLTIPNAQNSLKNQIDRLSQQRATLTAQVNTLS